METEIQKLLDALADLRKKANVNAVFGKPVRPNRHSGGRDRLRF